MTSKQSRIILAFEFFFIIFFIWFTYYGGFIIGSHFENIGFISEDGHNFINSAKLYKEKGLNVFITPELARQASLNYIITVILISFLMEFKDWLYLFVGINLTIFFLSYFILKIFLKNIFNNQDFFYLNILLIFFYFSNYENYFYVRLVLSDCIFTFFVLFLFIKFNSNKNWTNNLLIILICILLFFINPKFIAILFFLFFYLLIKYVIIKNELVNKNYLGTSLILCYLLGLFLWSVLYVNINFIDHLKGDIFYEIKKFYLNGTIIYNRTSLNYLQNDINIYKLFYLGILRSFSFFQFWSFNWDLKHNLVNLISIGPLYLGNILNIYYFNTYSKTNKKIVVSVIAMVVAFTFMSSITAVDYDWRYRYPLYSILLIGFITMANEAINKFLKF